MRRVALLAAVLAVALPGAAFAVWGGQQDFAHPGVGAIYFDFTGNGAIEADELICSGSYAGRSKSGANDVFLTAGHCLPPADAGIPANEVFVSFDGDGRNGVTGLIALSSYHQMPGFGHDSGDLHDLGILLLPAGSVPAGTPAVQLPRAGYLDQLKAAGTLKFRIADIVGYGVIPIWEPAGRTQFAFDGVRRSGTSTIIGLDNADVHYNQNRNGVGTGSGLCFGDSGSPQLETRHAARPLRHERRQRAVQCEQPELPGRHAAGAGVPRPIPEPAVEERWRRGGFRPVSGTHRAGPLRVSASCRRRRGTPARSDRSRRCRDSTRHRRRRAPRRTPAHGPRAPRSPARRSSARSGP